MLTQKLKSRDGQPIALFDINGTCVLNAPNKIDAASWQTPALTRAVMHFKVFDSVHTKELLLTSAERHKYEVWLRAKPQMRRKILARIPR